jgi:hypothetical protein
MTRRGLLEWLAAIGLAPDAGWPWQHVNSSTQGTGSICVKFDDNGNLKQVPCFPACKPGEERCPLGIVRSHAT